jgi:branched-chain amino acid aminotransferase
MDPVKKKNGISIVTSPYKQYENPLYSNNKIVGTYVNSIMALHDALARGSDEALLMDIKGNISEGSGENLFIVKNGDIFTPTTENCLNGITRQSIIKIASDLNLKVKELNLKYEDLLDADEAFFTGTAVEVTPISRVDDRIIGSGKIGSTTQKLQSIFEDIVSAKNNQYKDWLYQI